MSKLPTLLHEIRHCRECEAFLPHGPRPILQVGRNARILIIGQAPGRRVHESGVPWDDASGERLRAWMGIERREFYDSEIVALVPMGFCYPGTGESGDLPPRKECAALWHEPVMNHLNKIELTLLIGKYALDHCLPKATGLPQQLDAAARKKPALTTTVQRWQEHAPAVFPLPHPSPRNNRWLAKNPWFADELLPELRSVAKRVLSRL